MEHAYTSTLASIIQAAINECIECGQGGVSGQDEIFVFADWCENENDIEVTVRQAGVAIFGFTERGVADIVYRNEREERI